jgi:hypothetical protein
MVESNGISPNNTTTDAAIVYESNHLTFFRDRIDPLRDDEIFEIATPAGRFRMSRAEFYGEFPEITASSSYRDLGQYHYPMIPYKVFRFLVREPKFSAPPLAAGR